jgi:hypothetical protein
VPGTIQPLHSASSASLGIPHHQSKSSVAGGNLEIYKQLDTLREENFQLKAKQREFMVTINQLRGENEQLLDHAEQEIKRMSDFVDKYTGEAEANKKKLINEYEQRMANEWQKAEDVKARLAQEKGDAEVKYYKAQKEAE